jgi:UDP-glucuronate decarboxylase
MNPRQSRLLSELVRILALFYYVDDMISVLITMMNCVDNFCCPVNLGNPMEYTILQLAEKVIDLTKSNSKIEFLPLPENDPAQCKPDISFVQERINWVLKVNWEENLIKTIGSFRAALNAS